MAEETRSQKLIRVANEEWQREQAAAQGMSPEEKRAVKIWLGIMAVAILLLAAVFAASAEELVFDIVCPKEGAFCYSKKGDIERLIEHNNAVTNELKRQISRRCGSLRET